MPRAETEQQVLAAMEHHFRPSAAMVYPGKDAWNQAKAEAFERAMVTGPCASALELGVGELGAWRRRPELLDRLRYTGVEGSALIVEQARRDFPGLHFEHLTLGNWAAGAGPQPEDFDLAVCCDVLYHLPTDALHDAVLRLLFTAGRAVVFTYATDPREYIPAQGRPGASGWDYFPRPRAALDFLRALRGWEVFADEAMDNPAHICKQRLLGLVRVQEGH